MKIECTRDRLAEAVGKAEKITGKNLTLPVLGCVLLEAKDKNLIVRATNLDLGIEITIPVRIHEEGKIAIPGQVVSSFLSNIHEDAPITLETIEGNLKITTKAQTSVIKTQNAEDFPTIPMIEGEKVLSIAAKDVIRGIKGVWYSSATSSMKPELSSVYIHSDDDELVFVATDSFRLAEKRVPMKQAKDLGSLLIPVKNIPEIMRILEGATDLVTLSITKNQISFSFNGVYITSRVVDGVFPDYKQLIPKSHKTAVTVLKQDLINSLKIATIFSDKFNKLSIKVRPGEKRFELSTRNADVGETQNSLEAVCEGEDIDINFNYRYITDCFQSVESDSVKFDLNGPGRPLVISGIGDKSFTYLVMPINK